ncbi:hypothetical protein [uncultured Shimia sp.]|uniref:hypothetical protein n=1 Tax=uncultured Shimia sp. TaxID=573152 RepID=UPI002620DDF6|nr:hypothetical protein [uncultured Shimia sp.]
MRDFFINSLEKIVSAIIVLMSLGVVLGGLGTMFTPEGGIIPGLMVWAFGAVYVLVMGGMMYLALGIHDNTKRTAEATERMADKA